MSGKLDKSLDEILSTHRQGGRRGRQRSARTTRANGTTATAPVGGVRKSTRQAKPASKATTSGPAPGATEGKIMVSGLPSDVTEQNIKEYFQQSAGPVKRVILTYNQNGTSRGIASISFARPDSATKAAKELNGLLIDKRPIKIEVIVDANNAPAPPPAKPLNERVGQPKAQPKPASATKPERKRATRGRARRGRNAGRPKAKTADQLDAEMKDYFNDAGPDAGAAATNGAAQAAPANNEDTGMDEI